MSQHDDVKGRMIRYAIAMGIRTLCFIGAILTFSSLPWVAGGLAVAAIILPYIAVLLANIGRADPGEHATALIDAPPVERLAAQKPEAPAPEPRRAANAPTAPASGDAPIVLQGEVVRALESPQRDERAKK